MGLGKIEIEETVRSMGPSNNEREPTDIKPSHKRVGGGRWMWMWMWRGGDVGVGDDGMW